MSVAVDLDTWLARISASHPHEIELGLDRVRAVWLAMGAPRPAPIVITVGGTNGKGSTVAFLVAMLRRAGVRVGAYTSPHLERYNERVAIDDLPVDDAALCAAFERIDKARGDVALTYFEVGTLAAIDLFARAAVEVAVLEVGLGGRLDAVNLIDADVAVVTTIDLDHQDWLGDDRDAIGREKAGIARAGRPLVIGEADPPAGLLDVAVASGAVLIRRGMDFSARLDVHGVSQFWWQHRGGFTFRVPLPQLAGAVQVDNAATAIAALYALTDRLPFSPVVAAGVHFAAVAGRLQRLARAPELWIDVGHNPQAARSLADWLDAQPQKPTHAVFAALGDKDIAGVVAALGERIARWHLGGLAAESPRGLSAAALRDRVAIALPKAAIDTHPDIAAALVAARAAVGEGGRVLAFGSFFTVAAVLRATRDESR